MLIKFFYSRLSFVANAPIMTSPLFPVSGPMAHYVYTMHRVGKIVPPKRVILSDI